MRRPLTLRERYGPRILFIALFLLAWWMLSFGLHTTPEFAFFFPLNWFLVFPFGNAIIRWGASMDGKLWWALLHAFLTVMVWKYAFFSARGVYYRLRHAEGLSTWVLWGFLILCFIVFAIFLLRPAFEQLDLWWEAWPEGGVRGRI